ncbi:MAG TPA: MerR family transcriptional regulator [Solirubrobacteraceae bacterium]|nr:MerR family transcriptional regulator [Solirubrobacteraceae bacterium]
MQTVAVDALTINEAAETTGWSARMLRYIESIGLVRPRRSDSGYRLYGPAELQRLSSLRELLDAQGLDLGEVGFALRLKQDPRVREAIEQWLAAEPARPDHVSAADWLRFEQEKHQRLLAVAGAGWSRSARLAVPALENTPFTENTLPTENTSLVENTSPTKTMEIA